MSWTRAASIALLAFVMSSIAGAARAQHEGHGANGETLGTVAFETSCQPATRAPFDRAVALLHSFEFRPAIGAFDAVLVADPQCAMAHWGRALSYWLNPFAPGVKGGAPFEAGRAAAAAARATGAPTARERGYIAAVSELYRDSSAGTQRERVLAYAGAMERVAREYPADMEATIFYAVALAESALPTDKTYAAQLKAVSLLEPLFAAHPDHPGLAHYIIHACDSPALAARALDAARRYAKIAPSSPHALHMPSHTFTRVGAWQDSIDTNIASADAAMRAQSYAEAMHAMDYQMYAYLQTAQDAAAARVLQQAASLGARLRPDVVEGAAPPAAGYYARAAIPARYALERGKWADAASLPVTSSPTLYADAITHFARALGAARSGRPDAAAPDVRRLAELRDALSKAGETYWSGQVEIERQAAEAWAAFASGRRDEGLATLRAAADAEDASDKAAVTPGPLAPAREQLGEMLLETGRPADALAEFRVTLTHEPNRYRALAGAATAAAAAGDTSAATDFRKQLLDVCRRADTERPELTAAREPSR